MEDLFVPIISGGIYLGIITDMNTDGGDLVSKVLEVNILEATPANRNKRYLLGDLNTGLNRKVVTDDQISYLVIGHMERLVNADNVKTTGRGSSDTSRSDSNFIKT